MSSQGSEPANSGAVPVVRNIFDVSAEFLGQYKTWLEQNPPSIPITQIVGFQTFTVQTATIATSQTTTSTAYTDLATVGPTLPGLSNGKYLFLWGALSFNSAAANASVMALNYNGTADDTYTARTVVTGDYTSIMMGAVQTLSSGANTVKAQYKAGAANTATFAQRWLIALRYANP